MPNTNPPTPIPRRSYGGVTITIGTTVVDIHAAVLAIVAAQTPAGDVPGAVRELNFQADPGNGSGSTIAVGDSHVTTTNYAYKLAVGASRNYRSASTSSVPFKGKYAIGSVFPLLLNVEWDMA